MSQNRTIFPGVEPEGGNAKNFHKTSYSHNYKSTNDVNKGTVFPGMNQEKIHHVDQNTKRNPNKPLIGFVYSISKTGFGEYWPIYIGPNTIGRSIKNDIILSEGTVSEEHAVIVVRMMKNPERLDASVTDRFSSHGTIVNGESIPSTNPLACKNGDILTIGESYQLYLILIDSKALGLHIAEDFIDTYSNINTETSNRHDKFNSGETRDEQDFPPRFNSGFASSYNNTYPNGFNQSSSQGYGDQTVGINGNPGAKRGETVGTDGTESDPQRGGTEW